MLPGVSRFTCAVESASVVTERLSAAPTFHPCFHDSVDEVDPTNVEGQEGYNQSASAFADRLPLRTVGKPPGLDGDPVPGACAETYEDALEAFPEHTVFPRQFICLHRCLPALR